MTDEKKTVAKFFQGAGQDSRSVQSQNDLSSLLYISDLLKQILHGHKPSIDPARFDDNSLIALFQNMESRELLHENCEQFFLYPGQDPQGRMAQAVTSLNVLCSALAQNAQVWKKYLSENGIRNCDILGANIALRIDRDAADQSEIAQSFLLPEGDAESLYQFLNIIRFNSEHPSSIRVVAVDNERGFWDPLKAILPSNRWESLGVLFADKDEDALDFIAAHIGHESRGVAPLHIHHPFHFQSKNPVFILGTGNPKKVADFKTVIAKETPLIEVSDFMSVIGPFTEPPEKSGTCVGNALEKMNAMLDEVYGNAHTLKALQQKYNGRPIVLVANDTGARIQIVDDEGNPMPVDFLKRPELDKAKDFPLDGKQRWWPAAEVKMVTNALGKSTVFYTQKLPDLLDNISQEVGKALRFKYVDDSVYIYATLGNTRDDVKLFATKGVHVDDISFEDPQLSAVDFENFTIPRTNNPDRKLRADMGAEAVLDNSSTYGGIATFLNSAYFSEPVKLKFAFDQVKGNVYQLNRHEPRYTIGTLSAFDHTTRGSGFPDFKRRLADSNMRPNNEKYDLTDLHDFERYLNSVDGLMLGGEEGLSLSPLERVALICRVFVAVQTAHPSFAGKPLIFVKNNMDPVCDWVLKTQDFLYNHKLYGRRAQDSFIVTENLKTAVVETRKVLANYDVPVITPVESYANGNDSFDRPTVSFLGSASTYDPQHIGIGNRFAEGCAERDLHFRHGGCSRGVVGGAADAFAAYRDAHGKGRMTGIQCHGLVRLEGMNQGNDCVRIYETIGERKMDIYRSDMLVFGGGGWGTYEELFDALALIEAGKIKPDSIVIIDYGFDADPSESTYLPLRNFLDTFLTPQQVQKLGVHFVKNEQEAIDYVDSRLSFLWDKYKHNVPHQDIEPKIA